MAGMTEQGLTIKRLGDVLADFKNDAIPIFQDLVLPNDVVDTSDSSVLGRLIGLTSPAVADLYEAVQEVYWAFDPNSSRGIALDNLVQYGGLTRNPASPSSATIVVWGDVNTMIPSNTAQARATDNTFYNVALPIILSPEDNIGFGAKVGGVVTGEDYVVRLEFLSTSIIVSHKAVAGDTPTTIASSLATLLSPYSDSIIVRPELDTLYVEMVDIFSSMSVTVTKLLVYKIKQRGEVLAESVGAKEQLAGTINTIATPLLGWDSVYNPYDALVGSETETDEELRNRFRDSKYSRSQNMSDALFSSLTALDGVTYVAIYENDTDIFQEEHHLPPHSFRPIVLGGNALEIAQEIWRNKPLGVSSEGGLEVTILDSQQFPQRIEFDRPTPVQIFIDLTLTTTPSLFPSSGASDIKAALVEYFRNEFGIGQAVIYSRLYTPINSIQGHQVDSLTIGTPSIPMSSNNIGILYNQIASLSTLDINIITN